MIDALNDSLVSEGFEYSVFPTDSLTPSTDSVRWPAKWLNGKIVEIQQLAELPSNWDSYGARPIDLRSIRSAVSRIHALARETTEEPRVGCDPSGNVVLAWESDDGTQVCELEFLPDGSVHFMVADDNDPSKNREGIVRSIGYVLPLIPGTGNH